MPFADLPKLSRVTAFAATRAKFWEAFAPPMERIS